MTALLARDSAEVSEKTHVPKIFQVPAITPGGIAVLGEKTLAQTGNHGMRALDARTCFVKGTLVKTANGFVPIEQIKARDQVWSYNERTKSLQLSRVKQTFIRRTQRVYTLTYDSGTQVQTTGDHPFMIEGRGWRDAKLLRSGDDSLLAREVSPLDVYGGVRITPASWTQPRGVIVSVSSEAREETVYNFEVEGTHTYLVTEDDVVVHNAGYDRHPERNTPQAKYNDKINERGKALRDGETLEINGKQYAFDEKTGAFCEGTPGNCRTTLTFLQDGTIVSHDYSTGGDVRAEFAASKPEAGSSFLCQNIGFVGCDSGWVPLGRVERMPSYSQKERQTLAAQLPDTGVRGVQALQDKLNVVSPGGPDIADLAKKNPGQPVIVQIENASADMGGSLPQHGNKVDALAGRMFAVMADAKGNVSIVGGDRTGTPASSFPSYNPSETFEKQTGRAIGTSNNYGNALAPGRQYNLRADGGLVWMSPAYHVYENAKSKTDSVPAVAPYNYIDPQNGQLVRQGTRMRQSALYIHPACGAPGCASYGSTNSGGIGCSIYGGPMFEPAKSGQQGIYILVDRNRPNQFVKGE